MFIRALCVLLASAVVVLPLRARAACSGPSLVVAQDGRLLDATDRPVEGSVTVRFKLFALASAADDKAVLWDSGECSVAVKGGLYGLTLGDDCGKELCASLFPAGTKRYLEIDVAGTTLAPRLRMTPVPMASWAADAGLLAGLGPDQFRKKSEPVDANTLEGKTRGEFWQHADAVEAATLGGKTTSDLTNDFDARYLKVRGGLSATVEGDLGVAGSVTAAHFVGGGASLADVDAAKLAGKALGDLDGRYVQTGSSTAQTGDINLVGNGTFGGNVIARGFSGDGASLTNVNASKVGGLDPTTFVQKSAPTMLPLSATDPATCAAGNEGQLYLNSGTHLPMVCANGKWLVMAVTSSYGTTASQPGTSCLDIKTQAPLATSGIFFVNPGTGVVQVYCDMVTDGGGWTLVIQAIPVANPAVTLCTDSSVGTLVLDDTTATAPAKLASSVVNALWSPRRELLIKEDQDSSSSTRGAWARACLVDFKASYAFTAAGLSTSAMTDLDTPNVRCTTGTFAIGKVDMAYTGACGYAFQTSGTSDYLIYSLPTSYTGGSCGGANAGRTWLGYGNSGCNVAKVFVR